jgi:hypothetical protein
MARMAVDTRSPSAADAVRLARRRLLAGRPIRMQELAADLGVTRVTLHRWVGSRDDLLGEVLWSLAAQTFAEADRATRARGGRRVARVVGRFIETVNANPGMRDFIAGDPEQALRILTTKATPVQARSVEATEALIRDEEAAGRLRPPMAAHDLAYVIVRISESFLYADIIAGEAPDAAKARAAIEALLR